MHRVKGKKYPNGELYKQYLIDKNRITKSDRILITSIDKMSGTQFTAISYRKLFVKADKNYGFYRMKNVNFENWILIQQRKEKLKKIKNEISSRRVENFQ